MPRESSRPRRGFAGMVPNPMTTRICFLGARRSFPAHRLRLLFPSLATLAMLAAASSPARPQVRTEGLTRKRDFECMTPEAAKELYRMYAQLRSGGRVGPMAAPDIFGHGAVLTVGKVVEKVTNFG